MKNSAGLPLTPPSLGPAIGSSVSALPPNITVAAATTSQGTVVRSTPKHEYDKHAVYKVRQGVPGSKEAMKITGHQAEVKELINQLNSHRAEEQRRQGLDGPVPSSPRAFATAGSSPRRGVASAAASTSATSTGSPHLLPRPFVPSPADSPRASATRLDSPTWDTEFIINPGIKHPPKIGDTDSPTDSAVASPITSPALSRSPSHTFARSIPNSPQAPGSTANSPRNQ